MLDKHAPAGRNIGSCEEKTPTEFIPIGVFAYKKVKEQPLRGQQFSDLRDDVRECRVLAVEIGNGAIL